MEGPVKLAANLAKTLEQERATIALLNDHLQRHLAALQERDLNSIEEAAFETNECTARQDRLAKARQRQTRLLAKMFQLDPDRVSLSDIAERLEALPDGRHLAVTLRKQKSALAALAQDTQLRCEEVEFALRFAARLGEDLLQALRGINEPASGHTYNANGQTTTASTPRTAIDRVI